MNVNVMKTNYGKLFAAVAILAMLVCAFAIAMPSVDAAETDDSASGEETTAKLPAADNGVITLTKDITLTEPTTITDLIVVGDHKLTISADVKVDYTFTGKLQHIFTIGNGSIVIKDGSLSVDVDNASSYVVDTSAGNHVFYKTDKSTYATVPTVTLTSGSMTITEADGVSGKIASDRVSFKIDAGTATFNGNGMGPAYIVQNGGMVDFNLKDGSIMAYIDLKGGEMSVSGTNTTGSSINPEKAILKPYAMNIVRGAVLNVDGLMSFYNGNGSVDSTLGDASSFTIKTLNNLGTINILSKGSLDMPEGSSIIGTGTITNVGAGDVSIATENKDAANAAITNDAVDEVVYNGTETLTIKDLDKPLTVSHISTVKNAVIAEGGKITVTPADGEKIDLTTGTVGTDDISISGGKGTVKLVAGTNGFKADSVVFYHGSAGLAVVNASGSLEITGDGKIHGTINDNMTITQKDGANLVADDDIKITKSGVTLTVESGVILNVGSFLKLENGVTNFTLSVESGATLIYSELPAGTKLANDPGSIIKIEGGQGTENLISTDMTVSGDMYLSQETTIKEGVTVTVTRNSTLHLMSFDLINNGTIIVDKGGKIVSDNGGSIVLMSTGSIENNGIIGGDNGVTVYNGTKIIDKKYTQSVSINGIDGIKFTMDRDRASNDRTQYNMSVSGEIGRVSGVTTGKLILMNVGIDADMTIKSNIDLTITGSVTVSDDVTFTFGGNLMDANGGTFTLKDGASAVINAPVKGAITAQVGQVAEGNNVPSTQTVTFYGGLVDNGDKDYYAGVTGITISVDRVNKYNETTEETEVFQRMYVTGALDLQTQAKDKYTNNTVVFTGNVYVIDTLTVPDNVDVSGGTFMVSEGGSVVAINDDSLSYNGAMYSVESTDATNDDVTYYYVDFATAMANIATADEQEIVLSGTYEIAGTYTLAANQAIVNDDAKSGVTVGETGDITVELDADVQDTAFAKIYGKVLVKEGVGYTPSATANIYAVKAVDSETNDTTYSGFGVAMDEAQAGQTISVVGAAEYDGNLVIPNGVTVDVQQDVPLKVLGNVTVENGGKLILDSGADMTVGKTAGRDYTVTVAGELDASEGGAVIGLAGASVDFYSTGTSTFPIGAANFTNVDVNAAYYDDADRVYTTLAAAVAYAETNALPTVYAVGTFSETGAIESDEVDIVIGLNANVTLGDVTLNDAKISVSKPAAGNTADKAGQYTASVSGLSGAGDAAVTSTVSVSKTDATIESKVTLNAEGVNQYVLIISGLTGATTITAGTVQFADGADLSISRDNALTIASGATLLVAEDEDLTISIVKADPSNAGYFVNNGAIQLDGSLILSAASGTIDDAVLPGTVNVSETGAIDANGNVTVTGDVTVATDGKFNVAGILSVGETPDYLGEAATGSVAGAVTLDATSGSNYVVVYAGASVADAVIGKDNSTEPETTAFQVNGLDLMTVYTFGNETLDTFQSVICGLDDLEGYTYNTNGQPTGYVDLVWTAEGNTVPGATAIGEYAIVSTELAYRSADIVISVGTHITVTVDGIIVDNYYGYPLKIGTHTVSATVDPGYSGDVTITFNGQTVSNGGTIEITSEMLSTLDSIVLSVTGSLTQDSTVVVDGGNQGGSDMGLTDYLLIILVILIVIMAIIVALRLMRS